MDLNEIISSDTKADLDALVKSTVSAIEIYLYSNFYDSLKDNMQLDFRFVETV